MKLPRRKFLHLAAGAAALPVVSRIARAQAYPSRPVGSSVHPSETSAGLRGASRAGETARFKTRSRQLFLLVVELYLLLLLFVP